MTFFSIITLYISFLYCIVQLFLRLLLTVDQNIYVMHFIKINVKRNCEIVDFLFLPSSFFVEIVTWNARHAKKHAIYGLSFTLRSTYRASSYKWTKRTNKATIRNIVGSNVLKTFMAPKCRRCVLSKIGPINFSNEIY